MDVYYDDWDSLVSAVENKIPTILKNYVASDAEAILKKHIKEDIYDAYTPKTNGWLIRSKGGWKVGTYERRNDLVGDVYSHVDNNNTLLITSKSTVSPPIKGTFKNSEGAFLKLLESGEMGLWRGGFSRPAVSNAQDDIDTSARIKRAIKNGIKREVGICVEI